MNLSVANRYVWTKNFESEMYPASISQASFV